jgi:cyclic pyranopterin phosphate synthase
MSKKELSHLGKKGKARMVDVSKKKETEREAVAVGKVKVSPGTLDLIKEGNVSKGDVLSVSRLAGIMAAKKTHELIPLCHPLKLTQVDVDISLNLEENAVEIRSTVRAVDRTGVEMEALTAVVVSALTVYDMCKAVDKKMIIEDVHLERKSGGRSGEFIWKG